MSTVTTMVDRITPRTTPDDSRAVEEATGRSDLAPVATEPFHEWVLSGDFMAGRPQWQHSGATFTDDDVDGYRAELLERFANPRIRTNWTRSPPTARRSCRYGSCRHCGGNGSRAACHRAPSGCSLPGCAR